MPMVTVECEIEVFCGGCNTGLCNVSTGGNGCITVEPCEKCIETAKDAAYDAGYDRAKSED